MSISLFVIKCKLERQLTSHTLDFEQHFHNNIDHIQSYGAVALPGVGHRIDQNSLERSNVPEQALSLVKCLSDASETPNSYCHLLESDHIICIMDNVGIGQMI